MFSKLLRIAICGSSFLYTFYILCNFTYFLSKSNETINNDKSEQDDLITKTLWTLMLNTALISAFVLQHSVMASDTIKNFYYNFDIEDIERSIYNASSAAFLHLLITQWQPITWVSLWEFNTSQSSKLWMVTSIFHIIGWCIVYSGCVMMDISELAGLKQVYYRLSGRPRPMAMKSRELQKYFMHMRHPSFTGFLIILWIYPFMSLDRFILASILSAYMILMWTIDQEDYSYHVTVERKKREFSNQY